MKRIASWLLYPLNDEMRGHAELKFKSGDGTLLIFHAMTNDLICRFNVPEGTGNVVSLPETEKVLSIEEEMKLY